MLCECGGVRVSFDLLLPLVSTHLFYFLLFPNVLFLDNQQPPIAEFAVELL